MTQIKLSLICYQFLFYFTLGIAKDLYSLDMYRWTCGQADPRVVSNVSCSTRSLNRTHKAHSLVAFGQPGIVFNDIYVKIEFFQKTGTSYGRSIVSMEENFCGYLNGTSKSVLISILWPLLKRRTNLADRCPYTGMMYIKDFIVDDALFPPYLPEGFSRLAAHVRSGPKRVSMTKVLAFIEIKPKGAFKLIF